MRFCDKLRALRIKSGMTRKEIAKRLGKTTSAYGHWETGKARPSIDEIIVLAKMFGVRVSYLLGEEEGFSESKGVLIPILANVSSKRELFSEKHIVGWEEVPAGMVRDGTYFLYRVEGEEMSAVGAKEGYLILIRQQENIEEGKMSLVSFRDEPASIRRIYKHDGSYLLVSPNPGKTPIKAKENEIKVFGKAVWCMYEID